MSNDLAKERALTLSLIHDVLISLHKHFPWTTIEIAVSFHDRIGAENAFVQKVLENVLTEEEEKTLDEYLPECNEDGTLSSEIALKLMNSYASITPADIATLTSQPLFALNTEQKEECLPWDIAEQPINIASLGDEKTMAIVNIKMKLRELAMLRGLIARKEDDCGTECIAIDTVLEVLNFEMI